MRAKITLTEDDEKDICRFYPIKSIAEIMFTYNIGQKRIYDILNRYNIKIRTNKDTKYRFKRLNFKKVERGDRQNNVESDTIAE
jgi:hypothetical protein